MISGNFVIDCLVWTLPVDFFENAPRKVFRKTKIIIGQSVELVKEQ
jgi:hypothetical protein